MLLFSENSDFLIQNIAFDAFLHERLVASVNEPEGLNNIPRNLYSVQYSKALLLKMNSYIHHVYLHARDYFTKRQSTLPFRGIYVVGIETCICIYRKLLKYPCN